MTLLEISADLKEINRLLLRLCEAVEFAAGIRTVTPPMQAKKAGLDDVSRISNIATFEREINEELARQNPGRGGGKVPE